MGIYFDFRVSPIICKFSELCQLIADVISGKSNFFHKWLRDCVCLDSLPVYKLVSWKDGCSFYITLSFEVKSNRRVSALDFDALVCAICTQNYYTLYWISVNYRSRSSHCL